ncbi:HpaII family restriction endonuclease [Ruminobacter amylophilus]|uniref:HpaII family restriction endonuclease n=1 Tax=Ruminobacter amylophilus TaxID=867 RepID=UPI003870341C
MSVKQNKGEWSELYAFARLLKDGKIYAADENVNRIDDVFLPILKIIREDEKNGNIDYHTGKVIRIYCNGAQIGEVSNAELASNVQILFDKIFEGPQQKQGAFEIPDVDSFLEEMSIRQVKSPSTEKIDLLMQVHDIHTGFSPVVGFSVKSDVGSPPTLLNAGKNTRIRYEVKGITDDDMNLINSINKTTNKEYMKLRMSELFSRASSVSYDSMISDVYENNLIMLDSMLPRIYGFFVLYHFKNLNTPGLDCQSLCQMLEEKNPLNYKNKNVYTYKIKELLCASALGMTPGREWNGNESATGGYIIVKRDGDVLCYHLYNRNFFKDYLLKNTNIDRPSATRHDYGYVFKADYKYFIDLNIQIRFKSITGVKDK